MSSLPSESNTHDTSAPSVTHNHSRYDPTIEDSYAITRKVNGLTYNIHICDTAGQEEYRSLFSRPTLQADAFLLVYDITQAHTLDSLSHFTTLIRKEAEERQYRTSGSGMSAVPPVKMAVGNKCDLDERRQVKSTTGQLWAHDNRCAFVETSARNQINVEETFAGNSSLTKAFITSASC